MTQAESSPAKKFVVDFVDRNAGALARLGDSIFYFAELGMQEHETSALMSELLANAGFEVTRGISGFPTAFLATCGSGDPVIAMHTEFDANPDNSQQTGVAERRAIVEGAPGHCEGHNVNAAVLVAAALAVKGAMDAYGLKGTLKIFGAPAEEQLLSRPYFVRDGFFDDVDVALHDHISHQFKTDYGLIQSAMVSATFTFRGESAHAAMAPWKARDALDAVVLMDVGMAQFREHMEPGMTAHRVITHGGDQPNVIPARASVWWYFRHPTAEGSRRLFERARKIAEGAALMAACELEVEVLSAVWPVRGNQALADVIQRNIEAIGMPSWSDEEHALARELQSKAQVKESGLAAGVTPLRGEATQIAASNDSGDVSWVVPMGRLWFPSNIPNIGFHHWAAGVSLAMSIAHKGGVAGAKALAATAVDLLSDPALVERAKATFKDEIGEVVYRPLLPAEQKPPLELNRKMMETFRPAMREHYVKEKPEFV